MPPEKGKQSARGGGIEVVAFAGIVKGLIVHRTGLHISYGVALVAALAAVSSVARLAPGRPAAQDRLLIDDFTSKEGKSPLGTSWTLLPVIGRRGARAGGMSFEEHEQRTCLHLTGADSEDPGASVEARLLLHPRGRDFDARAYQGIRLTAKGGGGLDGVRLWTRDSRSARQHYQAQFRAGGEWQQIELPFFEFAPAATMPPLDPAALRSIAVVTLEKRPAANLYIDEIELYRGQQMYNRELTPEEERVIVHKGTERPFSGKYNEHFDKGVYTCRRCGSELFESSSKFRSECGWPSFDEQIPGQVKWQPDPDGRRTEIICNNCGAHLGHVFLGEDYTEKNTRYCVNSISMDFIPAEQRTAQANARVDDPPDEPRTERALFASGCFWGTEYYFQRAPGVISTTVGFTGGHTDNPTYKQVCTGKTGHAETTEVIYDPSKTSYEQLARLFFETHDFTQLNRQGPDVGTQYRSAIFYLNDEQKQIAEKLVKQLREMGYDVKTEITKAGTFWPAEDYHQDYYNTTGKTPSCHVYRKIF